jgi:hypothetical protein
VSRVFGFGWDGWRRMGVCFNERVGVLSEWNRVIAWSC